MFTEHEDHPTQYFNHLRSPLLKKGAGSCLKRFFGAGWVSSELGSTSCKLEETAPHTCVVLLLHTQALRLATAKKGNWEVGDEDQVREDMGSRQENHLGILT